ncbi:MAG: ATP-binding protein [Chloroflexota bacterium]|nr:hypothetical protein [Chloroflexota bacterium]
MSEEYENAGLRDVVDTLGRAGLEMTAEELADLLWLAGFLPFTERRITSNPPSQPDTTSKAKSDPVNLPDEEDTTSPRSVEAEAPSLYSQTSDSSTTDRQARHGIGSLLFRSPAATALPGTLELGRALRPLKRRIPSRYHRVLDEQATVRRVAEEELKVWLPILRPAPVRWLDVALVVDESASMAMWEQTVGELQKVFERLGIFRDIRSWRLVTDETEPWLHAGSNRVKAIAHPFKELVNTSESRLIIVVSDCVSTGWYSGKVAKKLAEWGKHHPVTLLQLLPRRMWSRTGLGQATATRLRAPFPAAPSSRLLLTKAEQPLRPILRKVVALPVSEPVGVRVPVVVLEPRSFEVWAQAMLGRGTSSTPGFVLPLTSIAIKAESPDQEEDLSADERVKRFRESVSPEAMELASYLAVAPVNLPVARLIQQTLVPDARQVDIAEVFLGGLLQSISPPASKLEPEYVQYEFYPGVRELLASRRISDRFKVLDRVSEYITRHTGRPRDFRSILADPTSVGDLLMNEDMRSFATLSLSFLRDMGGQFADLAKRLEDTLNPSTPVIRKPNVLDHQQLEELLQEAYPQKDQLEQCVTDLYHDRKLKKNPYQFGLPVDTPPLFYGRKQEMYRLLSGLVGASGHTLLVGPRWIGKSSFLLMLKYLLEHPESRRHFEIPADWDVELDRFKPAYLSLQSLSPTPDSPLVRQFFLLLLRAVARAVNTQDKELDTLMELFRKHEKETGPLDATRNALKALMETQPESRVLILLDEYDEIHRQGNIQIAVNLRDLAIQQKEISITLLISSTFSLYSEVTSFSSPLYNIFKISSLGKLEEEDAQALVIHPSERIGVEWSSDAVIWLLKNTGYRPAYIQLFCQEVIEELRKVQNNFVTQELVNNLAENLVEKLSTFQFLFEDIWKNTNGIGQLILSFLRDKSIPVERNEIRHYVLQHLKELAGSHTVESGSTSLDQSNDQTFRKAMIWLENVLDVISPNRQRCYEFSVPLFKIWLKYRFPIEKDFLSEISDKVRAEL